jgi:hypothetical protein
MKILLQTLYINCEIEYKNASSKSKFHEFIVMYNTYGIFEFLRCLYEIYILIWYEYELSNCF